MPYDPERHGPARLVGPGFHARVHALVQSLPTGAVTTYGDVAAALGSKALARHVGFALAALSPGSALPWWRVVAAGGRISIAGAAAREQGRRLRAEGHVVRADRITAFAARRFPWPTPARGTP
jgi:methylated-DNA-protein-cysteine methyltransferase-like protein